MIHEAPAVRCQLLPLYSRDSREKRLESAKELGFVKMLIMKILTVKWMYEKIKASPFLDVGWKAFV